jgi:hypothetical protein
VPVRPSLFDLFKIHVPSNLAIAALTGKRMIIANKIVRQPANGFFIIVTSFRDEISGQGDRWR